LREKGLCRLKRLSNPGNVRAISLVSRIFEFLRRGRAVSPFPGFIHPVSGGFETEGIEQLYSIRSMRSRRFMREGNRRRQPDVPERPFATTFRIEHQAGSTFFKGFYLFPPRLFRRIRCLNSRISSSGLKNRSPRFTYDETLPGRPQAIRPAGYCDHQPDMLHTGILPTTQNG